MKSFLLILITAFTFAGPVLAGNTKIEIRILPEAVVYGENYTLGEIAELDGFDLELIQKISALKIGRSPMPGKSRLVSAGTVRSRVMRYLRKNQYTLISPKKPLVSRASVKVASGQLKEVVLNEIREQYQKFDDVRISIRTRLRDVYIPKGEVSYRIRRIGDNKHIGGYSSWMLSLNTDGKEAKKILVRAKVEVIDDVVVAKSRIKRGSEIAESDLLTIRKDISKESKGYASEAELTIGQVARRDILPNEDLNTQVVESPVLVSKGSPVKLVFKGKNIFLSNIAKAMKSGRAGDIIPVRTVNSNKTIYAVVRDSNLVEVAL